MMTAFWLALRSGMASGLSYLLTALKGFCVWFRGLIPAYKVGFFLALSMLANLYQWHYRTNAKAEHKAGFTEAAAQCAKEAKVTDLKAVAIHEDRQSILDVLLSSDRQDNDKRLQQIYDHLKASQAAHAKLKAEKPLPVNCVFDDERVRRANQAIADAANRAVYAQ